MCSVKDAAEDAREIRIRCVIRLAGYKKPVEIRFVAELPPNSTGKLLRRALREQTR